MIIDTFLKIMNCVNDYCIILLMIFSVQFAGAQNQVNSDSLDVKITEVKAVHTTYWMKEWPEYKGAWRTDFDIENTNTTILNIDRLPRLILVNEENLDQFIETVMPKQDRADEICYNVFRIIGLADPVTGKILFTQFGFDSKLVMPITTIEQIDEYLKANCRLEFEQTKITREANYIPFDYSYLYSEHKLNKR